MIAKCRVWIVIMCLVGVCGQFLIPIDPREPRSFIEPDENEMMRSRPNVAVFMDGMHAIYQGACNKSIMTHRNVSNIIKRYSLLNDTADCNCVMTPTSFMRYADWSFAVPCMFGNLSRSPRVIYVFTTNLPRFVHGVLPFMSSKDRFVLVSGGMDQSVPGCRDERSNMKVLPGFSNDPDGGPSFIKLTNDSRIIHWFAENHDIVHPKLSTLPTGFGGTLYSWLQKDIPTTLPPFHTRAKKILVVDRIRDGSGQWSLRSKVAHMCNASSLCLKPFDGEIEHTDFVQAVISAQFLACVHGGGLDPSPKAWEALLLGSIPIIQHGPLDDAYSQFPVMFIDEWDQLFLSPSATQRLLEENSKRLAPFFVEGSALRKEVLKKLRASFWIETINAKIREHDKLHPMPWQKPQ